MKTNTLASLFFSLAIVTVFGSSTSMLAQERQMGGGVGITVFADPYFRERQTFRRDVPNLGSYGLNNAVSSLRIGQDEQWEVCERPNYQGRCAVVSGEERDLRKNAGGWIASVRPVVRQPR